MMEVTKKSALRKLLFFTLYIKDLNGNVNVSDEGDQAELEGLGGVWKRKGTR